MCSQGKVNKAYSTLDIIKRNFQHVDKDAFVLLYKALVRSHLEYANTVWSPYKQYLIEERTSLYTGLALCIVKWGILAQG